MRQVVQLNQRMMFLIILEIYECSYTLIFLRSYREIHKHCNGTGNTAYNEILEKLKPHFLAKQLSTCLILTS